MSSTGTNEALGNAQVAFDVPARPDSLRLLRLGVADRAVAAGLPAEAVDRARVVVDELAAVLVAAAAPGSRLRLVVGENGGRLLIRGEVVHGGPMPEVDRVVVELLDLCVSPEAWDLSGVDQHLCFDAAVSARWTESDPDRRR